MTPVTTIVQERGANECVLFSLRGNALTVSELDIELTVVLREHISCHNGGGLAPVGVPELPDLLIQLLDLFIRVDDLPHSVALPRDVGIHEDIQACHFIAHERARCIVEQVELLLAHGAFAFQEFTLCGELFDLGGVLATLMARSVRERGVA